MLSGLGMETRHEWVVRHWEEKENGTKGDLTYENFGVKVKDEGKVVGEIIEAHGN